MKIQEKDIDFLRVSSYTLECKSLQPMKYS